MYQINQMRGWNSLTLSVSMKFFLSSLNCGGLNIGTQGVGDLDLLTIGLVNDMFTERENDDVKYDYKAQQSDFD